MNYAFRGQQAATPHMYLERALSSSWTACCCQKNADCIGDGMISQQPPLRMTEVAGHTSVAALKGAHTFGNNSNTGDQA